MALSNSRGMPSQEHSTGIACLGQLATLPAHGLGETHMIQFRGMELVREAICPGSDGVRLGRKLWDTRRRPSRFTGNRLSSSLELYRQYPQGLADVVEELWRDLGALGLLRLH